MSAASTSGTVEQLRAVEFLLKCLDGLEGGQPLGFGVVTGPAVIAPENDPNVIKGKYLRLGSKNSIEIVLGDDSCVVLRPEDWEPGPPIFTGDPYESPIELFGGFLKVRSTDDKYAVERLGKFDMTLVRELVTQICDKLDLPAPNPYHDPIDAERRLLLTARSQLNEVESIQADIWKGVSRDMRGYIEEYERLAKARYEEGKKLLVRHFCYDRGLDAKDFKRTRDMVDQRRRRSSST